MEHVIRFVITHLDKAGDRVLATAMQGRNTYATPEEAQAQLDAMMKNNSMDTLTSVYGLPLEVRPCRCWPEHFDPKQLYFDLADENPVRPKTQKMESNRG